MYLFIMILFFCFFVFLRLFSFPFLFIYLDYSIFIQEISSKSIMSLTIYHGNEDWILKGFGLDIEKAF